MTDPRRRPRRTRGFTLLEAMTAAVVFMVGVTGVTIFASGVGSLTRRGALNSQMAQIARDEVNRRTIAGAAGLGATVMGAPHVLSSGITLAVDTEIFDVGGVPGAEVAGQLPGCANLAHSAQCVRVTVTDTTSSRSYQMAAYVTN